jgi:hypothetical protein
MSPVLVFELPLPPNIANKGGRGWKGKHFGRVRYFELLDTLVTLKQNPKPVTRWVKAEASIQMRTWRATDKDNANARLKPVLDWLQTRGYIVNDRDLEYELDRRVASRKDLGITLVLREAA